MAVIPKQPTQGLASEFAPLMGCGVALFDADDLGWPNDSVIPDDPLVLKSNPLMVAGYHQFLLGFCALSTGGTGGVCSVIQCDPTTGAELVSEDQSVTSYSLGIHFPIPFGAFTQTLTASRTWYVIKIGLRNTVAAGGALIKSNVFVFGNFCPQPMLLCQTR